MLGQHPELYGFPETYLLPTRTIAGWSLAFGNNHFADGLLQLLSELLAGAQTEAAICQARVWLSVRMDWPSTEVFRILAEHVFPRRPVYKDPLMVRSVELMQGIRRAFPRARYLHLTRHPVGYGRSVIKMHREIANLRDGDNLQRWAWTSKTREQPVMDPQFVWYRLHSNILDFLADVPAFDQLRVRGEDLVAHPEPILTEITRWLRIGSGEGEMAQMKHPENWPFAKIGPANAPFGGDPSFFKRPVLREGAPPQESLEGAVPWRKDGTRIASRVMSMAGMFGYS